MKRRLGIAALVLVVLAVPAYWWLFVSAEDAEGRWPIDLAELRKAARSIEGELPSDVRFEKVTTFAFPSTAMVAGSGWSERLMTCFSYQLVYPGGRTAVVDTAMDEKTARSELPVKEYDAAAWARVQSAMKAAEFVVVTHEHYDHIGGATLEPDVWDKTVVNPAQLEHPENVKPLTYPRKKPKQVVDYQGLHAVAPGVVLVRTPGHTPGSQLVYVQRADGRELLFLGDVAWMMENVDRVRERARVVTMMMSENRANVLQQLAAVKALHEQEPRLGVVAGHDGAQVEALAGQGLLAKGFVGP